MAKTCHFNFYGPMGTRNARLPCLQSQVIKGCPLVAATKFGALDIKNRGTDSNERAPLEDTGSLEQGRGKVKDGTCGVPSEAMGRRPRVFFGGVGGEDGTYSWCLPASIPTIYHSRPLAV